MNAPSIVSPPWWPAYGPHHKQALALWAYQDTPDLCYGGAAGGGKSDYLLMAASQFCAHSDYAALILRDTFQNLAEPGAIMDRAISWWAGRYGIQWRAAEKKLVWPSGAVIQFGHLSTSTAHLNYQSAEFQFIGIDEATAIPPQQLAFLHTRLRRKHNNPVPLRYRLATNPGGKSHEWVRDRYVKEDGRGERVYLPAVLFENPGIDQDEYLRELNATEDPILLQQLLHGDWDVQASGGFFDVDAIGVWAGGTAPPGTRMVRAWDLAATPATPSTDPDWTVGLLLAEIGGDFVVVDMQRIRAGPAAVETLISRTAARDGRDVTVVVEEEGGATGQIAKRHYLTGALRGYSVRYMRPSGSKASRAKPVSFAIANGLLRWNDADPQRLAALAELRAFSEDEKAYAHDDIVDALAMAYTEITLPRPASMVPELVL